jgi:hypothetical protein
MSPRLRPRAVETVSIATGSRRQPCQLGVSNATVSSDDVLSASFGQVWPMEGGEGEDGGDDHVAAGAGDDAAGEDRLGDRWAV